MKTKLSRRILSLLLMLCMVCTMLPGAVFAEESAQKPETESAVVTETEPVAEPEAKPEAKPEAVTETDPVAVTEAGPEEPETPSQEPSGETVVTATSQTENIVGEVFANAFNQSEEDAEAREEALRAYPTEEHEPSYYKDTLRLRYLQSDDGVRHNYLVYRDTYLIFSEEESLRYTVQRSEDGTTAVVSPAVPADRLEGRTGLIFLGECIGYDDILVFGGEPVYDGDTLVVPLKNTEEICLTELFSDGELEFTGDAANAPKEATRGVGFNTNVEGTNWSGKITSFEPSWPTVRGSVNVWKLKFELILNLRFDLGFELETTGASGGKESSRVASVSIPIEDLFVIAVVYNFQAKFDDDVPLKMKGTLITNMDISFDLLYGTRISKYRNPVTFSELTVLREQDYNRDVRFYIGSQLLIYGGFLELSLDFGPFSFHLGPVLSLNLDNYGGCHIIARHEKDQFSDGDIGSKTVIHTCTKQGEPGCIGLNISEVSRSSIYFKVDLFFDDWSFYLTDSGEKVVNTLDCYNSLTFGSGFRSGVCPHRFYKVPAAVWLDDRMTRPAPGMPVTVADELSLHSTEEPLISAVTDSDGKATLYLPYKDEYKYTLVSGGVIDGQTLAGSTTQTHFIQTWDNRTVNIILRSDATVTIKANIVWEVDTEKKDMPTNPQDKSIFLLVLRREAGTDDEWEWTDYNFRPDRAGDWTTLVWDVPDWTVPKFGFKDGRAFLYEYRVRVLEEVRAERYEVITPEGRWHYIYRNIGAYTDAVGNAELAHATKYYISYDEKREGDTVETTVTATAVVDIELSKHWQLSDPANKAASVYLSLLQSPATGWENKADARSVPNAMVVIRNPIQGAVSTLSSLEAAEVLTLRDDLSSIENMPLAIGEVKDSNDWSLSYTVPKYRNGIRMQYLASELDSSVIKNLLKYEYDLYTPATVKSFGNYHSIPGIVNAEDDYSASAVVINTDPLESNMISGIVRWQDPDHTVPDYVVLHIRKNGVLIRDLTLNKSDYGDSRIWFWTLALDDYDPDAEYTLTETIPFGPNGPEWVGNVDGLNVLNYLILLDHVRVEVQGIFEKWPENIDEIPVYIEEKMTLSTVWSLSLSSWRNWWDADSEKLKSEVKDISEYILQVPNIDGYVTLYEEPYSYTGPHAWGNLIYNFTVRYLLDSDNLKLHISKEWENMDASAVYPQEILVEVFRDDEKIAETTLTRQGSGWSTAVISKDADGKNLTRLYYDENYRTKKHVYTIREKTIDGYTTRVVKTDETSDDIYYTITNTWVGSDYMNVAGTVTWEGDEGKEYLRPESVQLSVVNSKEEYVKSITVPVNSDGTFEAKYLPGKDKDGNALRYAVLESHVTGYTAIYSEPVFDEDTRTWTCNVTNKLTGYIPITVKKVVEGTADDEDEVFTFHVEPKVPEEEPDLTFPAPLKADLRITGAGETKAEFLIDEDGLYLYSFKEVKGTSENCIYDEAEREVLILRTTEADGTVTLKSWVGEAGKEDIAPTDGTVSDTVIFTNTFPTVTIEKNWEIDLEKQDRPGSIQVVVQKKSGDGWKTVKLVELSSENDWKANIFVDEIGGDGAEFRVRELKEETALQELGGQLRDLINQGKDKYDEWLNRLKAEGKTYWDGLPEGIRNAADQGYDKLLDKLNATPQTLYDKLMEQLDFASAEGRIVYDEDDDEVKGKDGDDKPETNAVTYHVGAYASVLSGGTEDAHVTKYSVSYKQDGNTFTVTNKAILEIDVIKRWITIGGEDVISLDGDDIPDSAWLVLMCKPKAGALDNAADLAGSLGLDLGGVLSYEFPVINPEEGGMDVLTLLGQLTVGVDLSTVGKLAKEIFGVEIPSLAIDKADEDSDWKATFVVSKYNMGIPMEYKGAELSSEVIRQIVKYITKVDIPVSFNPFDKYISIPTKAIRTFMGITDPGDLLDFSKLFGAALEKVKSLTMADIQNFGPSTLLDDWHLMANVINIQITWDSEDDNTLRGAKIWKDDEEAKRPDTLTIHIKDGDGEIEGSPVVLKKSDFAGENEWTWSLELPEDADPDATYVVSEEYPEDYEYKDDYTCETDGYDLINTWHKDRFTISGQKIWKDDEEEDRPETIKIRLLADGQEVASAVTSKAGEWRYSFPDQPKTKDGKAIVYTVTEDPAEGYKTSYDGYNVINTKVADGKLVLNINRTAADALKEQTFVFRIVGAPAEAGEDNGSGGAGAISLRVMATLAPGDTEGSVTVAGLPAGEYTVTEESDWSWRYNASISRAFSAEDPAASHGENALTAGKVRISSGMVTQAFFEAKRTAPYWLHNCGDDQAIK